MTFETWLKESRTESGLSLQALANRSGLSRTQLHKYETGERRPPKRDVCLRLAAALGHPNPEDAWHLARRQRLQQFDEDIYAWVEELEQQIPLASDLPEDLQDLVRALRALPPHQRSEFCTLMWELIRIGRMGILVDGLPGLDPGGRDNWDRVNELGAMVRELTGGLQAHKKLEYLTVITKAHLDTKQIYLGALNWKPPDAIRQLLWRTVAEQMPKAVERLTPEIKEMLNVREPGSEDNK